jgi:hypothetical protein
MSDQRLKSGSGLTPKRMVGRAMTVVLSSVVLVGFAATTASARPAPINPPAVTGTVTTSSTGAITVNASGSWDWPVGTTPGKLNATAGTARAQCGGHFGVGWGIAWNDTTDTGYPLTFKHKGVTLNMGSVSGPDGRNVSFDSAKPCGTFDGPASMVSGTWTATHTYPAGTSLPSQICVVSYVLKATRPGHKRMYQVDTNHNDSLKNALKHHGTLAKFEASPNCFDPATFKASPVIVTTATNAQVGSPITDTAALSATAQASLPINNAAVVGNAAGTITFVLYGPTDTNCTSTPVFTSAAFAVNGNGTYGPVSFTPTQGPGSYRWIATYSGDPNNNGATEVCGATGEVSTVTAGPATSATNPPTSPGSSVPVVTTSATGGTGSTAATAPVAVTGATTVHTGEPWAGSRPFEIALVAFGISLMGLGFFERRRLALRKHAVRSTSSD